MVPIKKSLKIGSWETEYYLEPEYVSQERIAAMERLLNNKWIKAVIKFPCENPDHKWAGLKKFKKPSPFVRVETGDLDLPGDIEKQIYSIAKRPTLGMLPLIAHYRPDHRQALRRAAYHIAGIIQIGDFVQDDRYLADILGVPYYTEIPYGKQPEGYPLMNNEDLERYQRACLDNQYFWARTDLDKEYPKKLLERLEDISLVPVRADGCKSEFMSLGMAERLSSMFGQEFLLQSEAVQKELLLRVLPWHESFAVKPVQGGWGKDVFVHHIDDTEEEKVATKKKIETLVRTLGPHNLMLQPHIPPSIVEREGKKYYRLGRFYFVNLDGKYVFTGGLIQESLSRIVCGVEGACFTPLLSR